MTVDPVNIRGATPADIPRILVIERQAPAASHWTVKEYVRILSSEILMVAESTGEVVGFLCAKPTEGEWELQNIAMEAGFRRRGIAGKLLLGLIDRARKSSSSTVFLEVRESNLPARRFYEKHGFGEIGRRRNYYRHPDEDAVLYKLQIAGDQYQIGNRRVL
jgi:ribosomal-protein-alanine N-acetyltransferase